MPEAPVLDLATPVPLSLLDRSRARAGRSDADAVRGTVARARHAERLGYHRFWVAEHHAVPGVVGPAPAVLLAAVGAATDRVRLGSGGVMLPNHAPLVVAEQFAVLQALHPGRVDLGVGRSLGFTAPVRRALRREHLGEDGDDGLEELLALLDGTGPVTVRPAVPAPAVFALATRSGMSRAAALGLPVVVGGSALTDAEPLARYRAEFAPRAGSRPHVVALVDVLVADSAAAARRELLPQAWSLAVARTRGVFPPLPSPADVDEARAGDRERRSIEAALAGMVFGTAEEVGRDLADLVRRTGADELLVATTVHDEELQAEADARLAALGVLRTGG